jgi:hypothetical protein
MVKKTESVLKTLCSNDKSEAIEFCYENAGVCPNIKDYNLNRVSIAINRSLGDIVITVQYKHLVKSRSRELTAESYIYDLEGNSKERKRYVYDWLSEWWENESKCKIF